MADANVNWTGLDKLFAQFAVATEVAQKATEDAMKSTLAKAQQRSKALARVRTGYMKQNIQVSVEESSKEQVVGKIDAQADYSSYNEYGTFKMSAKPFIMPSVTATTPWFMSAVKLALIKAVKNS